MPFAWWIAIVSHWACLIYLTGYWWEKTSPAPLFHHLQCVLSLLLSLLKPLRTAADHVHPIPFILSPANKVQDGPRCSQLHHAIPRWSVSGYGRTERHPGHLGRKLGEGCQWGRPFLLHFITPVVVQSINEGNKGKDVLKKQCTVHLFIYIYFAPATQRRTLFVCLFSCVYIYIYRPLSILGLQTSSQLGYWIHVIELLHVLMIWPYVSVLTTLFGLGCLLNFVNGV